MPAPGKRVLHSGYYAVDPFAFALSRKELVVSMKEGGTFLGPTEPPSIPGVPGAISAKGSSSGEAEHLPSSTPERPQARLYVSCQSAPLLSSGSDTVLIKQQDCIPWAA